MEASKSTRRTKRDPQSRDFSCRCGKSYLSYAAAYTHVKQKHHLQKIFLENIGKPERERLPRGRPKQKKQQEKGSDVQKLEIVEDAILKMYTTLKDDFPRMIIEGNDHVEAQSIENEYEHLSTELRKTYLQHRDALTDQEIIFVKDLNRHFTEQVAARVKAVVNVLGHLNMQADMMDQYELTKAINELNRLNFWRGHNQINVLICQTLKKWKDVRH